MHAVHWLTITYNIHFNRKIIISSYFTLPELHKKLLLYSVMLRWCEITGEVVRIILSTQDRSAPAIHTDSTKRQ